MKYCILGSQGIGRAVLDACVRQGHQTIIMDRSGSGKERLPKEAVHRVVDARDARALAEAISGSDVLFFCASAPPGEWPAGQEALAGSVREACAETGVALVYLDTLDAYGNQQGRPLSESSPEHPEGPVALLRARLAAEVRSDMESGRLKACVARSASVFGPGCTGLPLGERVFDKVLAGKPAEFLGAMDMPHSFVYVKDLARSLVTLAEHEEAWGHMWHIPCPQPICQAQARDMIRDAANRDIPFRTLGHGLFDPLAKSMAEFLYQYDLPFIINHSRFSVSFGERTTPHNQAISETLEWYRNRAGIMRRYGF